MYRNGLKETKKKIDKTLYRAEIFYDINYVYRNMNEWSFDG